MTKEIEQLRERLSDKNWRLENLYLILDESGNQIPLVLRTEQKKFLKERHNRNFVPKARKLGLSTIIIIDNLDECLFTPDMRAGIVDITREDAHEKLSIARFAWDRGPLHPDPSIAKLWKLIQEANPLKREASGRMEWENGSEFTAGVRFTGKTPQRLHISEFGPISAQSPRKASDIKRGSLNSVPPDGRVDIETTMEGGQWGECYRIFKMALDSVGKDLTKLDWKLQFFSWVDHPSYILPGQKPAKTDTLEYFKEIEKNHGLKVPLDRQAFYELKKEEQREDIYQQYPTVIDECDRQIIPGQIFPEMKTVRAQGRVRLFNPEKGYPRFTCWDLGSSDNMAGWEVQPAGKDHNFLAWCAGEGAGASAVAEVIRRWEEERGPFAGHLLPHDSKITDKGSGKTYLEQLVECGIPREKIIVVPRIPDKWVGINEVRGVLNNAWFHADTDQMVITGDGTELPSGVQRVEGYRKKLEQSTGILRDVEVHDICSHTADALRTYAEALSNDLVVANVENPNAEGVVVVSGGFQL